MRLIPASFTASHGIYGSPRVFLDLREAGETCSKHRVARLMRVNNIRATHGYRAHRHSASKPSTLIPNLVKRRFCRTNRLEPSISRRGNCWDNAVAESFFGSLKKERVKKRIYKNRALAAADISEYIEDFYNPRRRHEHLGGVSPEAFEAAATRP